MSDSKQRILINATQPEETRIALVSEEKGKQHLYDVEYERKGFEQRLGNLYSGRITRIEPHLEAVFFDFGGNRQGFLPKREVDPRYYDDKGDLKVGQKMLIQIKKEERGNKGAAISSYISLAGSFLVLMPNNPRAGGISRRIDGDERSELREVLSSLEVPDNMGVIIRTAGINKSRDDLQWDLNILLQQWEAIEKAYDKSDGPQLIYQESDLTIRAIRDHLRNKVDEIWVDKADVHKKIKNYLQQIRPEYISRLKLYKQQTPLFTHYQIESQIETAFQRHVVLPSGGSIVIDHTEALTSIDINSARATSGGDIEETALNTNLEAVEECARQMRLRDIGGLVVIDLIDMGSVSNRQKVEQHLTDILQERDPARIQVGRISRFGLLEMSRQRLRPALGESSQEICPRCMGEGHIRGIEPLALAIMRILSEHAMDGNNIEIRAFVPINVASYLVNEKRSIITKIEQNCDVKIVIIPARDIETPHYHIDCITEDSSASDFEKSSYELTYTQTEMVRDQYPTLPEETPAVANILTQEPSMNVNIVKRLWHTVFGSETKETQPETDCTVPVEKKREPKPRAKPPASSGRNTRRSSSKDKERDTTKSRSTKERGTRTRSTDETKSTKAKRETTSRSRNSSNARSQDKKSTTKRTGQARSQGKSATDTKSNKTPRTQQPANESTPSTSKTVAAEPVTTTTETTQATSSSETKTRSRRQTRRQRTNKSPARKSSAKAKEEQKDVKTTQEPVAAEPASHNITPAISESPKEVATSATTTKTGVAEDTNTSKPRISRRRGRYVRIQKGARPRAASTSDGAPENKSENKEAASEEKSE